MYCLIESYTFFILIFFQERNVVSEFFFVFSHMWADIVCHVKWRNAYWCWHWSCHI